MQKVKTKVMLIGDTPENHKVLANMLRQRSYKVYVFSCKETAFEAIHEIYPNIVIIDLNLPEMHCYELCRKIKADNTLSKIPIIFISSFNKIFYKLNAFKAGASDYICKPYHIEEVLVRIELHIKIEIMQIVLEKYNNLLNKLVNDQNKEIAESQMTTIFALAKLSEARDDQTGRHIERIQIFCKLLAEYLKNTNKYKDIDDDFINNIFHASPLHDIGKVGMSDKVLLKKSKLNSSEFNEMKKHTIFGANTLETIKKYYPNNQFINMGINIARFHHEKWDGSGYPDGIKKDEIPLCARIMALADVYDTLRSKRCYKSENSHNKTKNIIISEFEKHFDPEIVKAFIALEDKFIEVYDKYSETTTMKKSDISSSIYDVTTLII
jgi:putative two-component system response regulator